MKAYLIAQEQATWSPPHGSKQQSEVDNDISQLEKTNFGNMKKCQYNSMWKVPIQIELSSKLKIHL
jgi:hypothetical protein